MRFLFDFISPYAYLGWTQIHALAARHGRDVEPVPVLFAGLLNAHGGKGPAEIAAKRQYLFKDVLRRARRFGVPSLMPPPSHPFNPLLALRAASFPASAAARRRLIDALYQATWAGGGGVESEAAIRAAAAYAELAPDAVVEYARSDGAKAELRRNTEAAIAAGVFGVPTVLVDDELFFGTDSFELLDDFLNGAVLPEEPLERWRALRPSAERRS